MKGEFKLKIAWVRSTAPGRPSSAAEVPDPRAADHDALGDQECTFSALHARAQLVRSELTGLLLKPYFTDHEGACRLLADAVDIPSSS